jgi:hypothetical protein
VLILGYFLNMPGEYKSIAESSIYSLAFASQFFFINNTGYFDQSALLHPLLHTWSLGNEFLAYIIVSIFLIISPAKRHICRLSDLTTLSLLVYFLYVLLNGNYNYLDVSPRMLLFFISFSISYRFNISGVNTPSDLILILVSIISLVVFIIFFGKSVNEHLWPNASLLLLPFIVIPLMLLRRGFVCSSLLEKALYKVGDYSYTIYLVHWPIIVYERTYFRNLHISLTELMLLVSLIIVTSILFRRFLEKYNSRVKYYYCLTLIMGIVISLSEGFTSRVPSHLEKYSSLEKMINHDFFVSKATYLGFNYELIVGPKTNTKSLLIIGDSHSQHILPIIKNNYIGGIYRIRMDVSDFVKQEKELNKFIVSKNVSHVLLAYRVSKKNPEQLIQGLDSISKNNTELKFLIMRDIPSFTGDPVACYLSSKSQLFFKSCTFTIADGMPFEKVANYNDEVWMKLDKTNFSKNVVKLNSHEKLCAIKCITIVNDELILRDNNHLNEKLSFRANEELFNMLFSGVFD